MSSIYSVDYLHKYHVPCEVVDTELCIEKKVLDEGSILYVSKVVLIKPQDARCIILEPAGTTLKTRQAYESVFKVQYRGVFFFHGLEPQGSFTFHNCLKDLLDDSIVLIKSENTYFHGDPLPGGVLIDNETYQSTCDKMQRIFEASLKEGTEGTLIPKPLTLKSRMEYIKACDIPLEILSSGENIKPVREMTLDNRKHLLYLSKIIVSGDEYFPVLAFASATLKTREAYKIVFNAKCLGLFFLDTLSGEATTSGIACKNKMIMHTKIMPIFEKSYALVQDPLNAKMYSLIDKPVDGLEALPDVYTELCEAGQSLLFDSEAKLAKEQEKIEPKKQPVAAGEGAACCLVM